MPLSKEDTKDVKAKHGLGERASWILLDCRGVRKIPNFSAASKSVLDFGTLGKVSPLKNDTQSFFRQSPRLDVLSFPLENDTHTNLQSKKYKSFPAGWQSRPTF